MEEELVQGEDGATRCFWGAKPEIYRDYHDQEWGRPVRDDIRLFEKLCLEGFQAGLSWLTILRKREGFRAAFCQFELERVANFGEAELARLLGDPGIVRHRGKIEAAVHNARRALELREEFGSLAAYFWRWEPAAAARPAVLDRETLRGMATAAESSALSKDLKKRGWRFAGPTTVYSFMQAMGLVNDHLNGCTVRDAVEEERRGFVRPG